MTKKILILFFAVFLLGLVVVFLEKPFGTRYESEGETPFYPELKVEDVAAIEIEYFTRGTRFEKDEEGKWQVRSKKTKLQEEIEKQKKPSLTEVFPADPQKVAQILEIFTGLKKRAPVSTNPEKQGLLHLTNVSLNVTLLNQDGNKLARLFLGKQGPDIFSTFIRDENSSEVYLVNKHLQGIFDRTLEEWKEKSPE